MQRSITLISNKRDTMITVMTDLLSFEKTNIGTICYRSKKLTLGPFINTTVCPCANMIVPILPFTELAYYYLCYIPYFVCHQSIFGIGIRGAGGIYSFGSSGGGQEALPSYFLGKMPIAGLCS